MYSQQSLVTDSVFHSCELGTYRRVAKQSQCNLRRAPHCNFKRWPLRYPYWQNVQLETSPSLQFQKMAALSELLSSDPILCRIPRLYRAQLLLSSLAYICSTFGSSRMGSRFEFIAVRLLFFACLFFSWNVCASIQRWQICTLLSTEITIESAMTLWMTAGRNSNRSSFFVAKSKSSSSNSSTTFTNPNVIPSSLMMANTLNMASGFLFVDVRTVLKPVLKSRSRGLLPPFWGPTAVHSLYKNRPSAVALFWACFRCDRCVFAVALAVFCVPWLLTFWKQWCWKPGWQLERKNLHPQLHPLMWAYQAGTRTRNHPHPTPYISPIPPIAVLTWMDPKVGVGSATPVLHLPSFHSPAEITTTPTNHKFTLWFCMFVTKRCETSI